jgi:hypothetical protein
MSAPSRLPALAVLGAAFAAVLPASADAPKPAYHVGDAVSGVAAKDVEGRDWSLAAARDLTDETALEAVRTAAADYGAKPDAKAGDALGELSGLKDASGAPDPALRLELARKIGRPFGLFPSEKVVEGWKTLGDAAAWVRGSATAPIVLMWWSPKCPTSARYEERIAEIFAQTGARVFPVASNHGDDDASIKTYLETKGIPYRVLIDRQGALADRFGAKRTPHCFLLDEKDTLRYSGQIDDDRDEGQRADWLLAAVRAVADGRQPDVLVTSPKG